MNNLARLIYDEKTTKDNLCTICGREVCDLAFRAHVDCAVNWVAARTKTKKPKESKSTAKTKRRL